MDKIPAIGSTVARKHGRFAGDVGTVVLTNAPLVMVEFPCASTTVRRTLRVEDVDLVAEPVGRHALLDPDGLVRFQWRCTETEALQYAGRYAMPGETVVGPLGRVVARGDDLYAAHFA